MAVTRLKSERCNRQRRSGSRVERSPARNLGCGSLRTNTPGKYDHWYCSDRRTQSQRRKLIVWRKNNQPVSHGPWCQGLWHCSLRSPLIILSNWQPFDGKVHKQYSKCKLIINIRVNIGTSISKNTNTNIKKRQDFLIQSSLTNITKQVMDRYLTWARSKGKKIPTWWTPVERCEAGSAPSMFTDKKR